MSPSGTSDGGRVVVSYVDYVERVLGRNYDSAEFGLKFWQRFSTGVMMVSAVLR